VDIPVTLAAHLAALTQALDTDDVDHETRLPTFADTVKIAVSSYTGLTITLALDGHTLSFTVHEDRAATAPAATSLQIPLAALTTPGPDAGNAAGTLLLYAATPGAFVDLAADLSYALGLDPTALVLDGHLPAPEAGHAVTGLDTHFAIDQAIGVLIGRGHTPESARRELDRLASRDHGDLSAAAKLVIQSASSNPPDTR
jgi:hypothetical protein